MSVTFEQVGAMDLLHLGALSFLPLVVVFDPQSYFYVLSMEDRCNQPSESKVAMPCSLMNRADGEPL